MTYKRIFGLIWHEGMPMLLYAQVTHPPTHPPTHLYNDPHRLLFLTHSPCLLFHPLQALIWGNSVVALLICGIYRLWNKDISIYEGGLVTLGKQPTHPPTHPSNP